jgi:hypothetical protein
MPGDDLLPTPDIVTDHAIDIGASPQACWPWLLQVGWGRGGWYTYRWVDRLLFPANGPSADRLLPDHQQLAVGDRILDGPPHTDCYFVVRELEAPCTLVLESWTLVPSPLRRNRNAVVRFSWAFTLLSVGAGSTRFHFRSRAVVEPWGLRWMYRLLLVPADFVMARCMCIGLCSRIERARPQQ